MRPSTKPRCTSKYFHLPSSKYPGDIISPSLTFAEFIFEPPSSSLGPCCILPVNKFCKVLLGRYEPTMEDLQPPKQYPFRRNLHLRHSAVRPSYSRSCLRSLPDPRFAPSSSLEILSPSVPSLPPLPLSLPSRPVNPIYSPSAQSVNFIPPSGDPKTPLPHFRQHELSAAFAKHPYDSLYYSLSKQRALPQVIAKTNPIFPFTCVTRTPHSRNTRALPRHLYTRCSPLLMSSTAPLPAWSRIAPDAQLVHAQSAISQTFPHQRKPTPQAP